tara:strand:+ start:61 stop:846 length:786 start_codon:yes stop_codon:yes gene_type:complete
MKIDLDKYYTNDVIVEHCLSVVDDLIIDYGEVIEPSAGNGAFSLKIPNCIAYDIKPEHESIVQQDFLKLELPYKEGRLVLGNPPFGTRNTLSVKFYKHACKMSDYIAFILPISQYDNNQQMYEFDLIHSEQLPLIEYSGVKLLCCFNIYKRPKNGINKRKTSYKLNDVFISEYRRGGTYKIPEQFDFAMNTYGASLGKEVFEIGTYCQENYLVIKNEKYRAEILNVMIKTDWKNLYPYISTPKIQTWKIYKYLKEQIPELT